MPTAPRRNKYCSDDDQGPARVHQGAFTPGSNGVQVRFIDPRKGPAMIRRSIRFSRASCPCGGMVDAADSKSVAGDSVLVQVRPGAPIRPQSRSLIAACGMINADITLAGAVDCG